MASTYLSKTLSTPTNNKIWTYSAWLKLASAGSATESPVSSGTDANNRGIVYFNGGNNEIQYYEATSGTTSIHLTTNRLFRDISAWYHIVLSVDTTQATDSDRVKIYVNGVQETSLATATYPTLDYNTKINSAVNMSIGSANSYGGALHFSGSMAHVNFIDGTAYDASTFGETNAASGIWTPLASPSVTYGTNGFFLKFASSGALGTDSSGEGNTFTVNGPGTQTQDAPSNVFTTLNPLNVPTSNKPTFANGNTTSTTPGSSGRFGGTSTLGMSKAKYYWEAKFVISALSRGEFGITYDPGEQARNNATASNYADAWCYQSEAGYIRNNNSILDTEATYTNGDIVMCALDLDNNYVYFGKNGTWVNSGDPTSGSSGTGGYAITSGETYFTITSDNTSGSDQQTYQFNFGNGYFGTTAVASGNADGAGYGIFEYAPPTGYYSLCTKNINTYG